MEEIDWLLEEGEDLDGLRREHVSYGNLEYVFEEQLRDDTRELRIWQDDAVVAATTYVGGEIPGEWDDDSYEANDIDWFLVEDEFEGCDDALDIYRVMKQL